MLFISCFYLRGSSDFAFKWSVLSEGAWGGWSHVGEVGDAGEGPRGNVEVESGPVRITLNVTLELHLRYLLLYSLQLLLILLLYLLVLLPQLLGILRDHHALTLNLHPLDFLLFQATDASHISSARISWNSTGIRPAQSLHIPARPLRFGAQEQIIFVFCAQGLHWHGSMLFYYPEVTTDATANSEVGFQVILLLISITLSQGWIFLLFKEGLGIGSV